MIVVKTINEPDFGCEGAPDNKPICDKIVFDRDGEEFTCFIPEVLVWQTKIDEGDEISHELFNKLISAAVEQ